MADEANETYEIINIGECAWRIEDGRVRMFLFAGSKKALLIDTGFGTGNIRSVAEKYTDLPIMLVNTHADWDHIGCNGLFEDVYMHPSEYAYYEKNTENSVVLHPLWEGDIIDIGGRSFDVILIPGHTPGSIALLDRTNRILIAGDSVTESTVFMFKNDRSLSSYIISLEKLLSMSSAFDTIYPSHGLFPQTPEMIGRLLGCAKKLQKGEIPAEEPPIDIPAKLYKSDGASIYY